MPVHSDSMFPVRDIKWSIEAVSRRVPGTHCLIQSFAAVRLLREYGYPAEIKFGVAKPHGNFSAHAWVELDGKVIIGGTESPSASRPSELLNADANQYPSSSCGRTAETTTRNCISCVNYGVRKLANSRCRELSFD